MQKTKTTLQEIKLMGISVHTSNTSEKDPQHAKIETTIQTYFQKRLATKITHRKNPGTTYCVYTEYETDCTGNYRYFIGEEVSIFDKVDPELETLFIPAQAYVKFTNGPGKMPEVCLDVWEEVWEMFSADLGGERAYIADFEVYDERGLDQEHTTLDIYIGVRNTSKTLK